MLHIKKYTAISNAIGFLIMLSVSAASAQPYIKADAGKQVVRFGNDKIRLTLDYNRRAVVTDMEVNGEPVLVNGSGIFSSIITDKQYSTQSLASAPQVKTSKNRLIVSGIRYGESKTPVNETWVFQVNDSNIVFTIERDVPQKIRVQEVAFPAVNFRNIKTWDGAFLGHGGLAWFYLFNEKLCTYGVHTGSSVFWNSHTGNGLSLAANAADKQLAAKFSRANNDQLEYSLTVSDQEAICRYDSGTNRRRFIRGKTDVWNSFELSAGKYTQTISLTHIDYKKTYGRGELAGINGQNVSDLLNTIARIGVIDAKLFGGNSWHTPYGPICLHEQYIAQMGIAINDPAYTEGYRHCLENYRDHAIQDDGRVIARWAYTDEDAMPGTASALGFYEAQWGYLMDSNPDFVTNVAELYDQNGDLNWVRTFKSSCEKALDYMLKRDSNSNYLVEMKTDSYKDRRGSDWIDIIWASYENAFVNAKLYYALKLWAKIEKQLGDESKSKYYEDFAAGMKRSFNKSTSEGGFWDEKNNWYVHWLEKDGSVHGNNLVVPVNFMAIAYGICDNEARKKAILQKVEDQMRKENLFAWPLCMYTYAPGEGNDWQFPFPNYENGDIFLSWGAVGVDAYASYDPELALKYIENILARYEKDGLAFQRYGRAKQDGLGDDILSGNSLALVGLYKSVYGVNPKYNRLYLKPQMADKLYGTTLNYHLRGDRLKIVLAKGKYSVSNDKYEIASSQDFGYNVSDGKLQYFHNDNENWDLQAALSGTGKLGIVIKTWNGNERSWEHKAHAKLNVVYQVNGLGPNYTYKIYKDNKFLKNTSSDLKGMISFSLPASTEVTIISIRK